MEQIFAEHHLDKDERYEQLRQWLEGDEYILPTRELVNCYFDWLASNRVVWPFAGGRLQQPEWITVLWRTLERLDEFYKLKKTVVKEVTLPVFNASMFGGTNVQ